MSEKQKKVWYGIGLVLLVLVVLVLINFLEAVLGIDIGW